MNDEDMDTYVFAVGTRKALVRLQKEMQDLVCCSNSNTCKTVPLYYIDIQLEGIGYLIISLESLSTTLKELRTYSLEKESLFIIKCHVLSSITSSSRVSSVATNLSLEQSMDCQTPWPSCQRWEKSRRE